MFCADEARGGRPRHGVGSSRRVPVPAYRLARLMLRGCGSPHTAAVATMGLVLADPVTRDCRVHGLKAEQTSCGGGVPPGGLWRDAAPRPRRARRSPCSVTMHTKERLCVLLWTHGN